MGKSTISMAIFNSFLYVYQRVNPPMTGMSIMTPPSGWSMGWLWKWVNPTLLLPSEIKNAITSFTTYGYGSIPINTIFSGMNIHLPAILMFTRGTRFWHTAISLLVGGDWNHGILWLSIQLGMECHHPNWRTHSIIFQRGRSTTNHISLGKRAHSNTTLVKNTPGPMMISRRCF